MNPPDQSPAPPRIPLRVGAWHGDREIDLAVPLGWHIDRLEPDDAPALDDDGVRRAFAKPIGTPPLRELARGRRKVAIAVDDVTRPTPAWRILPALLAELHQAGIDERNVLIVVGTAAHRPMDEEEVRLKVGADVAARIPVLQHDFMGPDLRSLGWIEGGPVELNRAFLEADLRLCIGGAVPHDEAGFGGGAKLVVPGLAGRRTIAHFHGALPPRRAASLEADGGRWDRRRWSEAVARHVGVDAIVCAVMNGRAELANLFVGDLVEAHRAAARRAGEVGRTPIPRDLVESAEVAIVNAYPLDTDPIQMGKTIAIARKLEVQRTVVVNAASDGVFYHGMGMGSGLHARRLLANLPGLLARPGELGVWLRGMLRAARDPLLVARLSYFSLNHLAFASFEAGEGRRAHDEVVAMPDASAADPLVWSAAMPTWGFHRRYPKGRLFREWEGLCETLAREMPVARALVFPCAPLQVPEIVEARP